MYQGVIEKYTPHVNQRKLHNSTALEVLVVASIRSGKTFSIIFDAIVSAWNNKSGFGTLICAPSFRLLESVIERPLVQELISMGLLESHSYSKHESRLKNNNIIYYRSVDKDSVDISLRGLSVSKIYVDEAAYIDAYAMDIIRGRAVTTNAQIVLITTPNGTNNWVYEKYFSNGPVDGVDYIHYNALDNPIITQEALDRLRESYDDLTYRQEVLGEFINLYQSRVYHQFSDLNIMQPDASFGGSFVVYIGIDYNIGVNATVLATKRPDGSILVYDEIIGILSTSELAEEIKNRLGGREYVIVDDSASGLPRQQGTGLSNRAILHSSGLFNIVNNTHNPGRLNRYTLMNAHFNNAANQKRLFVSPNCKALIKDLNTLTYKKNSPEIDTQNNKLGHISDALGYLVWYLSGGQLNNTTPATDYDKFKKQRNFSSI